MSEGARPPKKKAKKWVEPRRPEAELKQIALGIVENRIFTSAHLTENELPNMMPMIFLPLMLADQKMINEWALHPPMLVFAEMKYSMSRSINGYPMFLVCSMLYKQDAEFVTARVNALRAAIKVAMEKP